MSYEIDRKKQVHSYDTIQYDDPHLKTWKLPVPV